MKCPNCYASKILVVLKKSRKKNWRESFLGMGVLKYEGMPYCCESFFVQTGILGLPHDSATNRIFRFFRKKPPLLDYYSQTLVIDGSCTTCCTTLWQVTKFFAGFSNVLRVLEGTRFSRTKSHAIESTGNSPGKPGVFSWFWTSVRDDAAGCCFGFCFAFASHSTFTASDSASPFVTPAARRKSPSVVLR